MKSSKTATKIIDGKKAAAKIEEKLRREIAALPEKPVMAVVLVGDNPASLIYVSRKQKTAERIGVEARIYHLSPVMTQDALIAFIQDLNQDQSVHGIIVQLPLPSHISENDVLETISPEKDIDGLHPQNLGYLFIGKPKLIPCTPLACLTLIKSVVPCLTGKTAVVIGRSRLVGKPAAQLLLNEQCTVIQAHSHTKNLKKACMNADIVVSATGQAGLIRKPFVKKGAVLIDVGIIRIGRNKITGDIAFKEMLGHAGAITPVPGGVGPMTIVLLMQNVLLAYRNSIKKTM